MLWYNIAQCIKSPFKSIGNPTGGLSAESTIALITPLRDFEGEDELIRCNGIEYDTFLVCSAHDVGLKSVLKETELPLKTRRRAETHGCTAAICNPDAVEATIFNKLTPTISDINLQN